MALKVYQKWEVAANLATNPYFNPPYINGGPDPYFPNPAALKWVRHRSLALTGGGLTLDMAGYTTIDNILVQSAEPIGGNFVTVTFRTAGGAVDVVFKLLPGDWFKTGGSITTASGLKLVADTASVEVDVIMVGT